MNDYLNYKWKQFLYKKEKPIRSTLNEGSSKRGKGKGGVVKAKVMERSLPLPVPQISEAWGKPGNADRAEAEKLLRRVATGATWQEKIENLNTFVNSCRGDDESTCLTQADSTILSKLMALDILAAIVYDFQASISGFLFEVFVATLIGADSEQVVTTQKRSKGESGDIADIMALGKPMSLKLLRQKANYIEGSYNDLISSIIKHRQPITYLVALKESGDNEIPKIRFYEFTIGSSAVIHTGGGKYIHTLKRKGKGRLGGDFDIDGEFRKTFLKGKQFKIPAAILRGTSTGKAKGLNWAKEAPTALLDFGSRADLEQVANNYVKQLNTDVVEIYNKLEDLSTNINDYLINGTISAGERAVTAAGSARYYTKKLSKKE